MASTGWKAPTKVVSAGTRTPHWTNTAVVTNKTIGTIVEGGTPSSIHADVTLPASEDSDGILATGYGININKNSRIDGIIAKIARHGTKTKDNRVYLKISGANSEDNKAKNRYRNDYLYLVDNYGSSSDLWGETEITPAQVNSDDFGLVETVLNVVSSTNYSYMHVMDLNVYFTDPTYSLFGSFSKIPVNLNEEFIYNLTLRNTNGINNGITIPNTILLPAGVTYVSQSGDGTFNPSTGKWNVALGSSGVASISLTLKVTTIGSKTINASVDGFSTFSTRTMSVNNPDSTITVDINSPESMELLESYDIPIEITGNLYETSTKNINFALSQGFKITNMVINSSSGISNKVYAIDEGNPDGMIQFNLSNINISQFNLTFTLTVRPYSTGQGYIQIYTNEDGVIASQNIDIDLTHDILANGSTDIIKRNSAAIGFTDKLVAIATGSKDIINKSCRAVADVIFGYIGPIQLKQNESPSVENLKNTTKNTLIKKGYKNRVNIGKQGDYDEDLPLTIRLHPKYGATLQGMVESDEPYPVNVITWKSDGDPLVHRGYIDISEVGNTYINPIKSEFEIKYEYVTRNLKPPIYIHRLNQPNKYNIKPLYPIELMNSSMDLTEYFKIITSGTVDNRTISLTGYENCIIQGLNQISTPASFEYTWNSENLANIERIIRIKDDNGNSVLEYIISPSDDTGEDVDIYLYVYDTDGGLADQDNDTINLTGHETTTIVSLDGNIATLLETGDSGNEYYKDSIVLPPGNYYFEVEIKHDTQTNSTTIIDFNIDETYLLTDEKANYLNQIVSPFALPDKVIEYIREAEDGVLYYYRQDETISKYYAEPFVIYKGGVNITNESGSSLLSSRYQVDPIVITNGLVKVMFSYSFRMIWTYLYDIFSTDDNENKWILTGRFKLTNMENTGINYNSQDKGIISCGGTLWTLYKGRSFIEVLHSEQDLYVVDEKDTLWRDQGEGIGDEENVYVYDNEEVVNVASGTDYSKDTSGFVTQTQSQLTSDTSWAENGSRSIHVKTQGSVTNEGVRGNPTPAKIGELQTARIKIKGSGTIYLKIQERNSSGTWVRDAVVSDQITLSSTPIEIIVAGIIEEGSQANWAIHNCSTMVSEYNADGIFRIRGNDVPDDYSNINSKTGDIPGGPDRRIAKDYPLSLNNLFYMLMYNKSENYGLQIVKPDYSTVYSNKIPKNAKTVIIPYKRNDKEYNLPAQLAMEWLSMWEQKINTTGE